MDKRVIALVDCNNFFVSCERLRKPELVNVPVCVLSNNDGCVVSRSNEAKRMGVEMGAPYFICKNFFKIGSIHRRSRFHNQVEFTCGSNHSNLQQGGITLCTITH